MGAGVTGSGTGPKTLRVSVITTCVIPVLLLKISSVGISGHPNACGGLAMIGEGTGTWRVARISTLGYVAGTSVSRSKSRYTLWPGRTLISAVLSTLPLPSRKDTRAEHIAAGPAGEAAPVASGGNGNTPGFSTLSRAVWPVVSPTVPNVWTCGKKTGSYPALPPAASPRRISRQEPKFDCQCQTFCPPLN